MVQSLTIRRHFSFFNCLILVILLVGFSPIVFSSPTSSFSSNPDFYDSIDEPSTSIDDLSSSTVQDSPIESIPNWYIQPRTHANDFLYSTIDENDMNVGKSDHDDSDDQAPFMMFFNKRSAVFNHHGGFTSLKKRKPLNKAPMEVMNEIVNSIYLKR